MFENISKGEFKPSGNAVHNRQGNCVHLSYDENRHDNAQFIAYCFNLQQHYDISKMEEVINLLEKQLAFLNAGFDIQTNSSIQIQIEGLLKEIKK